MGYPYGKQRTYKPSYDNTVGELQDMVITEKNIYSLHIDTYTKRLRKNSDNINHYIYGLTTIHEAEFLTDEAQYHAHPMGYKKWKKCFLKLSYV
jgi:hypothetical protein